MPCKRSGSVFCAISTKMVVLIAGLFLFSGCYEMDEAKGSLLVPFSIDYKGLKTCEAAGIVSINAVLNDGVTRYDATAKCTDYEVAFEKVTPGNYDLTIYGLNAVDLAIADSLGSEDLQVEIR